MMAFRNPRSGPIVVHLPGFICGVRSTVPAWFAGCSLVARGGGDFVALLSHDSRLFGRIYVLRARLRPCAASRTGAKTPFLQHAELRNAGRDSQASRSNLLDYDVVLVSNTREFTFEVEGREILLDIEVWAYGVAMLFADVVGRWSPAFSVVQWGQAVMIIEIVDDGVNQGSSFRMVGEGYMRRMEEGV